MSRSTQFVGLSKGAEKWISKYCVHSIKTIETTIVDESPNGEATRKTSTRTVRVPKSERIKGKTALVRGMFGEVVHELQEYTTKSGLKVREYVQAEPWSSGPVIFLALRYVATGDIVKKSLWSDEEIDNC